VCIVLSSIGKTLTWTAHVFMGEMPVSRRKQFPVASLILNGQIGI